MRNVRYAFTLTEVFVMVLIIAVLSGWILRGSRPTCGGSRKQAHVTLELLQLGGAIEDLNAEFGNYPPNLMANSRQAAMRPTRDAPKTAMLRMFKKAFPRHQEPEALLFALAGEAEGIGTAMCLEDGLSASEAIVFWLGGFSDSVEYPISGPGGPSFSDVDGNSDGVLDARDEDFLARNMRLQFDLARLGPRTNDELFDDRGSNSLSGRYVEYDDPRDGTRRRINFWRYYPNRSKVAIVYFDTSRYTPSEYYPAIHSHAVGNVGPLMQRVSELRADSTSEQKLKFVEQGQFQLLHAGLDDSWGDFSAIRAGEIIVPNGPFVGEIADTLANFMPGTLEHKQE